ncbi:hypothetical protein [Natrarchaeobius oligotrophus]|uniref:Uncharacterized protein n=1 Tax=Natrarchaeobius chitinivorans TaxID=1679083 RepID=A0A3N6NJQ0_NATCH|nr:hypothetical protein [Natrarchaeobius chitinivorans]RQG99352.1 hypothetical protein EA472_14080 [Natrarchaeobius chitinivorans]
MRKSTTDSRTYELVDDTQFAVKAAIIGGSLGGGVGLAVGGPLVEQFVLGASTAAVVTAGLYRTLCSICTRIGDGSGRLRIETPGIEHGAGNERGQISAEPLDEVR